MAGDLGKVIPTCLALVLCDSVKRATRAGEASVLRAFEFFEATRSLPESSRPFTVWMQFRNGNGRAAMRLVVEFVPPGDLDVIEIITVRFSVVFQDPNAVVEHEAVFDNGLVFEHEGRYRVRVVANGVQILRRHFGVFSGTP
jgi:hypothetical protein